MNRTGHYIHGYVLVDGVESQLTKGAEGPLLDDVIKKNQGVALSVPKIWTGFMGLFFSSLLRVRIKIYNNMLPTWFTD